MLIETFCLESLLNHAAAAAAAAAADDDDDGDSVDAMTLYAAKFDSLRRHVAAVYNRKIPLLHASRPCHLDCYSRPYIDLYIVSSIRQLQ